MLSLFRTNQALANILILIYLGIVRISTFIHPPTFAPRPQGVLSAWMFEEVPPTSFVGLVAAFVLVFVQAVFINILVAKYRIAQEINLLPGVFYCLVASLIPDFLVLSPILLANTFLILAAFHLFDTYRVVRCADTIFNVGIWLGVAALFHFSIALFVLWGIVGLGILRGVRPKELLMFLVGIVVPFFLFGSYLFWTNNLQMLPAHFTENLSYLNFIPQRGTTVYVKLGAFAFMIFLTIILSSQLGNKRGIASQKFISLLYWMLMIGGCTVLFQSHVTLNNLLILSVPLGILLSLAFQRIGAASAEALHMLLLVGALIIQFEYLLVKN